MINKHTNGNRAAAGSLWRTSNRLLSFGAWQLLSSVQPPIQNLAPAPSRLLQSVIPNPPTWDEVAEFFCCSLFQSIVYIWWKLFLQCNASINFDLEFSSAQMEKLLVTLFWIYTNVRKQKSLILFFKNIHNCRHSFCRGWKMTMNK